MPDTPGDEDSGHWAPAQSGGVFLTEARWNNRGTDDGKHTLASVSVSAEDKPDALIADPLHVVGIMAEQERGIRMPASLECAAEVLLFLPQVADSTEVERSVVPPDGKAGVREVHNSCYPHR